MGRTLVALACGLVFGAGLAISGMTTASLELQMAGNEQYQERAFQAADAGIEQAMATGVFNTNAQVGAYNNVAAINPVADRGTGQQIVNCPDAGAADGRHRNAEAQTLFQFRLHHIWKGREAISKRRHAFGDHHDGHGFCHGGSQLVDGPLDTGRNNPQQDDIRV